MGKALHSKGKKPLKIPDNSSFIRLFKRMNENVVPFYFRTKLENKIRMAVLNVLTVEVDDETTV